MINKSPSSRQRAGIAECDALDCETLGRVLDSIRDALVIVDSDWCYTYVNARAAEIAGMPAACMLGRSLWELSPELLGTELEHACRRALATGAPQRLDHYHRPSTRWFEQRIDPTAHGLAIFSTDITERRLADGRLDTVLASLDGFIMAIDHAWRITHVNPRAVEFIHEQPEDIVGRDVWEVFPAYQNTPLEQMLRKVMTERAPGHAEAQGPLSSRRYDVHAYPSVEGIALTARGIDKRKHAATSLREQKELLRQLMDNSGQVFFILDPNLSRVHYASRMYETLFGRSVDSLYADAMSWLPAVHPGDRAKVEQACETALDRLELDMEFRVVRGDGAVRWVRRRLFPVKDASGQLVCSVAMDEDVSERKQAERALRDSEERFRELADSMPQIVWTATAGGAITFINAQWVSYTGLSLEHSNQPHRRAAVLHPDDRERTSRLWARALATGEPHEVQYRMRRRSDGAYRWFLARAVPCLDSAGRVREWFGTATDIDEQKRAEEALRESEQRFRMLADSAPVHIWMDDVDGRAGFVNARYCEFTGLSAGELMDTGWQQVIHPGDRDEYLAAYRDAAARRAEHRGMFRLRRHDGVYRRFEAVGMPRFEGGRLAGYVGCSFDVTERFDAEEALREADRRKDEFLATLAHELRNPLSPMSSAVHLLRQPSVSAQVATRAMDILERQLAHMVRLIDDLLDINRISRNKLELRKERIELGAAIAAALETSRPLIEASGHQLTVSVPDEPVYLDADLTRLGQVFANLLTNAAKYTDRGGHIRLGARRHGDEVVVSVADDGIGIAPEHLPRLFQMFSQLAPALQRSQGGLGIGLTLVRGLVEMHGGQVAAYSEGAGKGSEFVVTLPVAEAPALEPDTARAPRRRPRSGYRVLVVDDLADAADTLAMMVSSWGHEVRTAHDGLTALQVAAAFRPAVILLDIGLPELDGYDVARRIRARPWGERTVIIALTGWGQEEDRRRAFAAGCDHHLTKPVDRDVLADLLASISADLA